MPINMHAHSLFSVDGWQTPEELVERQAERGVTVLSLTDHNALAGLSRCRARAEALGMRFVDGVELDAFWQGEELHFLAFGFDPAHAGLRALCERQFAQYPLNYARIHPIVEQRCGVDRATLIRALPTLYPTHPAPVLNKWFARAYLEHSGLFPNVEAARAAMKAMVAEAERDVPQPWDWVSFEAARDAAHAAGGILLLAHVASYRRGDWAGQAALIESLLAAGLDGFELYHPSNTREPHFSSMEDAARRWGCAVSGGADSHGALEPRTKPAPPDFVAPDWLVATLDSALARAGASPMG